MKKIETEITKTASYMTGSYFIVAVMEDDPYVCPTVENYLVESKNVQSGRLMHSALKLAVRKFDDFCKENDSRIVYAHLFSSSGKIIKSYC